MVGNNKNWKLPVNSSTGDIAFKDGDDENGKISSGLQKSKLTLIINPNATFSIRQTGQSQEVFS